MEIRIVDPTQIADWNQQIARLEGATIFHTAAWAAVLTDAYGYRPFYSVAFKEKRLSGCIPVMEVASCLTGRRGVGLPFTDLCPPLAHDSATLTAMHAALDRTAAQQGWQSLQIRGGWGQSTSPIAATEDPLGEATETFLAHTLDLTPVAPTLFKSFKSNTRRNIRKAERQALQVQHLTDRRAVCDFYYLNTITRRAHGLPPQPLKFFKALHRRLLTNGFGFVTLAFYRQQPVAGAVYFYFNGQMIYKYGASLPQYQALRANNLLMWLAMQKAQRLNCTQLHLGRTDLEHQSLRRFKLSWNPAETRLHYYTRPRMDRKPAHRQPKRAYPMLTRLPLPLLRLVGTLLYRHVG